MTNINMVIFDFDGHFRRMERAEDEEFAAFQQELHDYLNGPVDEKDERIAAWRQALARLRQRSETELALVRELIGTPEAA